MIGIKEIQSFFMVFMAVLGFVSIAGGVINMISKWDSNSKPAKNRAIIKNHEERIKKLEEKNVEHDSSQRVLCNGMLALLSHSINGNSIDRLKEAKNELEQFLIKK